jgi:hypothetical protein
MGAVHLQRGSALALSPKSSATYPSRAPG